MRERPAAPIPRSPLTLRRIERPGVAEYRALFRLVGARWLWFSRLIMPDARLTAIIHHPAVKVFAVEEDGKPVGMIELDFRQSGECELAFIGLVPELAGRGHGRLLLAETLARAWRNGVKRVHVHTCTLDHPAALGAYQRAGFVPFKRAIERFPDPRLLGILPMDCAPQVPLWGTVTSGASAGPLS
ncbi:MAG TPA: GNAT family N-acetyltransferase [Sphingomicrobium sp.]|nr:GNAT family N-acetyltransferase [Sphingomicrobium sp.]